MVGSGQDKSTVSHGHRLIEFAGAVICGGIACISGRAYSVVRLGDGGDAGRYGLRMLSQSLRCNSSEYKGDGDRKTQTRIFGTSGWACVIGQRKMVYFNVTRVTSEQIFYSKGHASRIPPVGIAYS